MSDWLLKAARDFGWPVVLCVFFVWQGSVRESRMTERIETLEQYIRTQYESVIKQNTDVLSRVVYELEERK